MNDSNHSRLTRNRESRAAHEPVESSSYHWMTVPILILVGLLAVLGLRVFPAHPSTPPASSSIEPRPGTTPPVEATMITGRVTLSFEQQFCFSLGKPVAKGGDIAFRGRWRYQKKRLLAPGGLYPMKSGNLREISTLPVHRRPRPLDLFTRPKGHARQYAPHADLVVGQCYAVLCADKKSYAKVRLLDFPVDGDGYHNTLTFEWAYMSDGSPTYPN